MNRRLVRGLLGAGSAVVLAFAGASAASAVSTATTAPTGTAHSQLSAKLSQAQAEAKLKAAGITWSSSGGCSDRNNSSCTSFDQINSATVDGVITLKNASSCAVNITGGTETGHASGTYSHANGYKVDVGLSDCLTHYIENTFSSIGGSKWQSGSGNVYYYEGNHWDITYRNCGGC